MGGSLVLRQCCCRVKLLLAMGTGVDVGNLVMTITTNLVLEYFETLLASEFVLL